MRVLTWHVHGSYLYYLALAGLAREGEHAYELFLPVREGRPEGYGGRNGNFAWPHNVHEVPAERVADLDVDVVLTQSWRNYAIDRHEICSPRQRGGPLVHLEHDPPREQPTDTRHFVDDSGVLLVHCTHFNDLMWDSGDTRTQVVEHGVAVPEHVQYTGERQQGITVVNQLAGRGRRCGADVFERVRGQVPLVLAGMGSESLGGLGDLPHAQLLACCATYRFFFNPIRYTSLGLAVCEAMMLGLPVVGLATTEMVSAVDNGVSGWVETDVDRLVVVMRRLLDDPDEARRWGEGARDAARERFSLARFGRDWARVFADVAARART